MRVSVIGGSSIDDETRAQAREVGRLLGESGHTVVCGGLGGVMAAACRGAREHDAETIGLLPAGRAVDRRETAERASGNAAGRAVDQRETAERASGNAASRAVDQRETAERASGNAASRRADANEWVTTPIATGLGNARNPLVVLNGDAVVAIDGAAGTLSELGHALDFGRPVAGLDTHDVDLDGFRAVDTPRAAVDYVESAVDQR